MKKTKSAPKPKSKSTPKAPPPQPPGTRFPHFAGIGSLAGALGIPRGKISECKKAGCPAFDSGSRVDSGKLLRWLLSGGVPSGMSLDEARARLAEARAKKLEREEAARIGNLIPLTF